MGTVSGCMDGCMYVGFVISWPGSAWDAQIRTPSSGFQLKIQFLAKDNLTAAEKPRDKTHFWFIVFNTT